MKTYKCSCCGTPIFAISEDAAITRMCPFCMVMQIFLKEDENELDENRANG